MTERVPVTAGVFLLLVVSPALAAKGTDTPIAKTDITVSSYEAMPLSPTEKIRARAWHLSAVEWRRYQQLMQGIRGSVSPATLSPIEVLGIHARDEAERRRYAEAWAQAMYEDAGRILAFQHAYDAALKQLYPNEPLIDIQRLPQDKETARDLQSDDRLLFFTRTDCAACDRILRRLLARIRQVEGLDIYLIGLASDDDQPVRDWASQQAIDSDWVRTRRITLNHDGGALEKLTEGQGNVPYLLRRRDGVLTVLSPAALQR
jgi:integrating conjugative element protein (TIGR03759 family)